MSENRKHPNEFFDKIYCVNLDRRKDRWNHAFDQFDKLGLNVKRISAVDGSVKKFNKVKSVDPNKMEESLDGHRYISPAEAGITFSHKTILMDAIANGYDKILMLEDDCQFTDNFLNKFTQTTSELPEDWDLFYLGGQYWLGDPIGYSNRLNKTNYTLGMHAIGIRSTIFEKMLSLTNLKEPVDVTYAKEQYKLNSYIAKPMLINQKEGIFSDIKYRINIVPDTYHDTIIENEGREA